MKSWHEHVLRHVSLLCVTAFLYASAVSTAAGTINLDLVLQGLSSPVYVTNAHDDSNRLFIVEQAGRIKVLAPGAASPTVFLDIASKVRSGGEQGLLGLAFHPQFGIGSNTRFFVSYPRRTDGATVIAEYHVSADPNVAATTETIVLTVPANHNGGMIEFGPDGFLYIGTADGTSGNDTESRAQNSNDLSGKILRIDVDHRADGKPYRTPPGNPYSAATGGSPEVYAVGLRNPYRFSFDRRTGELYVGDVGQAALHEVDIVKAGGNYGWRVFEGNVCTGLDPGLCDPANYVSPIAQYAQSGGRCSITGGYVYRGAAGTLPAGTYVFGDYCTGEIFSLTNGTPAVLLDTSLNISSFGEDEAGEIYVVGLGGTVQRLSSTASTKPPRATLNPPVVTATSVASTGTNVASASAGAVATASSIYNGSYPASAVNNDERAGANWGNGGGWNDGTAGQYPDWVQINFNGSQTIDRVVVYTVQDNYTSPIEPTDTMTFLHYGITDFTVQGWNGTAWVVLGTVTGNNLVKRTVSFAAFTTDRIRINVTNALANYARITEIEAFGGGAPSSGGSNVALASGGAVATASSSYNAAYPVSAVNNNERAGANWGNGGGWNDGTAGQYPDWVQINFSGSQSIDRVVVYTVQDNYTSPVEPTDTMTFLNYGITDFTVQGWNGTAWVVLGTVSGNNLVKRTVTFPAFTTDRIRINVTNALSSYARITEIEAWGAGSGSGGPAATTTTLASSANPATSGAAVRFTATINGNNPTNGVNFTDGGAAISGCTGVALTGSGNSRTASCSTSSLTVGTHNIVATYAGDASNAGSSSALSQGITASTGGSGSNVALASAGAVATASSSYSAAYPPSAVNDNERAGTNWGNGGGWHDATAGQYPDWVQINFNGSKTIDRVVVYTVQDNYTSPVEPTDTMTFLNYGITDFTVQGWNGSAWVVLGTVAGNNLVKRTVNFTSFTTDRIRINVTNALASNSRITEVEAWGAGSSTSPPPSSPGGSLLVQMTDAGAGNLDGPTYQYANRIMFAEWAHPGGDWRDANDAQQGAAHYAVSQDVSTYAVQDVSLSVTNLVSRLLVNNTGIYLNLTRGLVKISPQPKLRVVTSTGTFDPPCIVDTYLDATTNQPQGAATQLAFPAILKFDLSGVTGTLTSATLTVNIANAYNLPAAITADYLDPPKLNLNADGSIIGTRVEGIAATVAKDSALASLPSVLIYDDLVSSDYILANFQAIPPGRPRPETDCQFVDWAQYGLKAARCWALPVINGDTANTGNQRLISWHHFGVPKQNPPKPWQRDYGDGYTHLFFRFLMEIGTDVKVGMTEDGIKLPGLAGTYDWSTSGAYTQPPPDLGDVFSARLWHSKQSNAHPDIYRFANYYYGADHSIPAFPSDGDIRLTSAYLKAGRVYSIEQEVKLNTPGVPDGEMRVWVDGVLVYERLNCLIRGNDARVRIQDMPFLNIYHGGLGKPIAPFHYDIGGIVIATEYIGPPKNLSGTQTQTPARSRRAR